MHKYALLSGAKFPKESDDFKLLEDLLFDIRTLFADGLTERRKYRELIRKEKKPVEAFKERWLGNHVNEAAWKSILWQKLKGENTVWEWPGKSIGELDPTMVESDG